MSVWSWFTGLISSVEKEIPDIVKPASAASDDISRVIAGLKDVITYAEACWKDPTLQEKIEDGLSVAAALDKIATVFDPAAAVAGIPIEVLQMLVPYLAPLFTLKLNIVADGKGGWVPSNNSTYDPATGNFL